MSFVVAKRSSGTTPTNLVTFPRSWRRRPTTSPDHASTRSECRMGGPQAPQSPVPWLHARQFAARTVVAGAPPVGGVRFVVILVVHASLAGPVSRAPCFPGPSPGSTGAGHLWDHGSTDWLNPHFSFRATEPESQHLRVQRGLGPGNSLDRDDRARAAVSSPAAHGPDLLARLAASVCRPFPAAQQEARSSWASISCLSSPASGVCKRDATLGEVSLSHARTSAFLVTSCTTAMHLPEVVAAPSRTTACWFMASRPGCGAIDCFSIALWLSFPNRKGVAQVVRGSRPARE